MFTSFCDILSLNFTTNIMKIKIKITRTIIQEREFIIEANDNDEARKNAKLALHQTPDGLITKTLASSDKSNAMWYWPKGAASKEDTETLPEITFEKEDDNT